MLIRIGFVKLLGSGIHNEYNYLALEKLGKSILHVARERRVVGPRREAGHGLVALDPGLDLVAVLVEMPAAVTVGHVVGVLVLDGAQGGVGHERVVLCEGAFGMNGDGLPDLVTGGWCTP